MNDEKKYIAIDLGAESGRVMLGIVSADNLRLHEIHRFLNGPIEQNGSLHWDFGHIISEVKTGIGKAVKEAGQGVAGIGIDSWGVDFGLLDKKGKLIENPYHYRDKRTNGIMEKAFERMPKREIYEQTGIQFMQFNSVYQLFAMQANDSPVLKKAGKMLFIADLVSYFLTGKPYCEYTLASTSQMMDMRSGQWAKAIFEKLNLPFGIMPECVLPGTEAGKLSKIVREETGSAAIPVFAVASHDSANAVAAVPADKNTTWAYISSGTWSVIGIENPKAIINDKTFTNNFTNEGGIDGTIRLLTNIMGLWLIQECKRQWKKEGTDYSYAQLAELAQKARLHIASINTSSYEFLAPGNMPQRINEHLKRNGYAAISDKGQIVRVILESLASKYYEIIKQLEEVAGKQIDCIHIVGGGSQNELLNQFTADATGKTVLAGPAEATAIGNIVTLARASGQIKNLWDARRLIAKSFSVKEYRPGKNF